MSGSAAAEASGMGEGRQQALAAKCYHPAGAFTAFPRSALERGVPARFEQQAALRGERMAVRCDDGDVSYAQLNGAANDVAHALLACAGAAGPFAAVLVDHPAMNVAASLGVLKAGRAFVPIDPQWPAARMGSVLEHCRADVVLTSAGNLHLAREIARRGQRTLLLEDVRAAGERANPGVPIAADAPACITYTSGSTGRPKGVLESHRNLLHEVLRLTSVLHVCPSDRQTLLRTHSAGAQSDTFTALLNGAALFPYDVRRSGINGLGPWLEREGLTIWRSAPSLFRALIGAMPARAALRSLRILFLCGEAADSSDLEGYRARCGPACVFVNCLGTTECATVAVALYDRDAPAAPGLLPIGYPVEDMEVQLVDDAGDAIPGAGPGEIVVSSRYLAQGYVGDAELTARSFRDDPADAARRRYFTGDIGVRLPDGSLVCLGRTESRANVNGHSFDLAEIEAALKGIDGVRAAAVVDCADAGGASRMTAYIVPQTLPLRSADALRRCLGERVPAYMIPSRFVAVGHLPLTATGKVDRAALAGTGAADAAPGPPAVAPRTPLEAALTAIWKEVLATDRIGVHDDFLDAGGNSLHAARIIGRVLDRFPVVLDMRALLDAPTISAMAAMIAAAAGAGPGDGSPGDRPPHGSRPERLPRIARRR